MTISKGIFYRNFFGMKDIFKCVTGYSSTLKLMIEKGVIICGLQYTAGSLAIETVSLQIPRKDISK